MTGRPWHTPSIWTKARLARLRDLVARGLTYESIGDYFGVTAKSIQAARKRYGLPARDRGWKPKQPKQPVVMVAHPVRATTTSVLQSDIPWPTPTQRMGRR